jgi:ribosomal protein S18 acetylase RimI-like enzyme
MTEDTIRPLQWDDLVAARRLIAAVDLFPDEMLPEMAAAWLEGREAALWLIAGQGAALAYAAPERLTDGTWNLLLLAVDPTRQGQGLGRRLVAEVEQTLRKGGARLLLVETSGVADFEGQRRFYTRLGFHSEGRIRDYYQDGDDKVIFAKPLSA